ncbi:MAG: hypothetical protein ACTSXC_04850 [Candidatus Freyarchaeota archaeon]
MYREASEKENDSDYVHELVNLAYAKGVRDGIRQIYELFNIFSEPADPKVKEIRQALRKVLTKLDEFVVEEELTFPPFSHTSSSTYQLSSYIGPC